MFCNLALPQRKIITLSEIFRFQNRIELPSSRDISLKLLLAGAYPGVVMPLGDPHAACPRNFSQQQSGLDC